MRITGLLLDGPEGEDEKPTEVSVRMTIREALYLSRLLGKQSGNTAGAVMAGGGELNSEIYAALCSVFNRFWEDGDNDALRELSS